MKKGKMYFGGTDPLNPGHGGFVASIVQEDSFSELDLSNVQIGKDKYLPRIQMKIEFGSDLPMDIEQYFDKLEKIAEGIELCWKIFSPHSQQFFSKLSLDYLMLKEQKFRGFKGLIITLKLMIISWKSSKNLLDLYKRSFLLIPEAVDRALRTT